MIPGMFQPVPFTRTITRTLTLDYLIRYPAGCSNDRLWPAVVFLHGAGSKGRDLGRVEKESLPRLAREGLDVPFILVCPQCAEDAPGWPVHDLAVLVAALQQRHPIDPARLCLTGISMGGRGAWEYAYGFADTLAALVPLCGPSIPNLAPRLKNLPVWAFHGDQDDVVPIARTDEMIAALKAAGNNDARCTRLAGVGHSCGQSAYTDPGLWAWLAEQRRATT